MFLLLAAGFLFAATALVSEWMGGFSRKCRFRKKPDTPASASGQSTEELIYVQDDDPNSGNLHFDRNSSAGSNNTLEGRVIHVTEESIEVHQNLDTDRWEARRSSSVDLDMEVNEIFQRDRLSREIEVFEVTDENRELTVSEGAFGHHIDENKY